MKSISSSNPQTQYNPHTTCKVNESLAISDIFIGGGGIP